MRHCNHSRRIWIRVVEETADGERIQFGADELTLAEDATPVEVPAPQNPQVNVIG
jgi:hypothetical protein